MGLLDKLSGFKKSGANKELETILGNESSRKKLLQVANTNEKQDAIIDKLFADYDQTKDRKTQESIKKKIESTMENGPKTKAETMLDAAFDAFLSGNAKQKTKVAEEYLGADVSNPEKLLQNVNDVFEALNNHQKITDSLAMKAATVLVYGQLYGMGGVVSKKECEDHNKMLKETASVRAIWNTVFQGKKGSR